MTEAYTKVGNNVNVIIDITTEISGAGNTITKDADGYYCDVPLAVLNKVSYNNTYYESEAAKVAITDKNSLFNHRLRDGTLFGEYNHPIIYNLSNKEAILRTLWLEPKYESHHIRRITVSDIPDLGLFIFGDIKPSGVYKAQMEEKLSDINMNCAFSLRALTHDQRDPRGFLRRRITKLVTFDGGVPSGGFKEASKSSKATMTKSGIIANESTNQKFTPLTLPVSTVDFQKYLQTTDIALENIFTQYELNNIFGFKKLIIKNEVVGLISDKKMIIMSDGDDIDNNKVNISNIKSPMHILF